MGKRTYMYRGKKCVKYSCGGRIKKRKHKHRRHRHVRDGGRGRYMERKRKARKKTTAKKCASKWRCGVSGLTTPVAINAKTGDVQCMSTNGKDCWWGKCQGRKVPRYGRLKPLACGAHHKKMWGGTGYNSKGHWCNKVKKPVAKMCKVKKAKAPKKKAKAPKKKAKAPKKKAPKKAKKKLVKPVKRRPTGGRCKPCKKGTYRGEF